MTVKTNVVRPIITKWIDASFLYSNEWLSIEKIENNQVLKPVEVYSVGYLVVDKPDYIILASSYRSDTQEFKNFRIIPKKCLIETGQQLE